MTINLSNLITAKGAQKKRKRVGRGNASGHGTYSTRGMKGQRSRSGGKRTLKALGLKMVLRGIPKKRGFVTRKVKFTSLSLSQIAKYFKSGDIITPAHLVKKGLISKKEGKLVKILAHGDIKKPFTIKAHGFSESASSAIIKAGGKVLLITRKPVRKRKAKYKTQIS